MISAIRASLRLNSGQMLVATVEDRYDVLVVMVGVLSRRQSLMVHSRRGSHEVLPVSDQSFYQLNGGDSYPIELQPESRDGPQLRQASRFSHKLPPPLSVDDADESAGNSNEREDWKDNVHTLYPAFLVDDQPFAVDLEFRVDVETTRVFSAPAIP